jgi:D-alanyl-D-alanine carboxypeptidase
VACRRTANPIPETTGRDAANDQDPQLALAGPCGVRHDLERVTHDSYADQLTKRILVPLGLHDTCYGPDTCPASFANRMPTGYFFESVVPSLQGIAVPALNLTFGQGAGAIISSLQDLATWDRALYGGVLLPARQQRELESLVSMQSGQPISTTTPSDPEGYGLGVAQLTSPGLGTIWSYEGETFGFRVLHVYLPGSGTLVALAANSAAGQSDQLSPLFLSVLQTLESGGTTPAPTPTAQAREGIGFGVSSTLALAMN